MQTAAFSLGRADSPRSRREEGGKHRPLWLLVGVSRPRGDLEALLMSVPRLASWATMCRLLRGDCGCTRGLAAGRYAAWRGFTCRSITRPDFRCAIRRS